MSRRGWDLAVGPALETLGRREHVQELTDDALALRGIFATDGGGHTLVQVRSQDQEI